MSDCFKCSHLRNLANGMCECEKNWPKECGWKYSEGEILDMLEKSKKQHSENSGIPKDVLFGEPKECTMECDTKEPKCRWGAYIKFLHERNKVLSEQASIMRKIELADFKQGLALGMAIPPIAYMIVMFLVRIFR